jgi:hypothetical protein
MLSAMGLGNVLNSPQVIHARVVANGDRCWACKLNLRPTAAKRDDQSEQSKPSHVTSWRQAGTKCAEYRWLTSVAKVVATMLVAYLRLVVSSLQHSLEIQTSSLEARDAHARPSMELSIVLPVGYLMPVFLRLSGGEGGIRTLGTVTRTTVFEF